MGFFGGNKNKEKIIAIFDIGSGSVGGALVKIFPNTESGQPVPIIITQARKEIAFQDELNFEMFFNDMLKALYGSANDLLHMKMGAPEEVICVLASPWYVGETRQLHKEEKDPFVITEKIINEIVNEELNNLSDLYKKKYEGMEGGPKIIESKIFQSRLNGYLTDEPLGKRAKSLDISLFVSVSPSICLNKIQEQIEKVFHHTPLTFTTFLTSLFTGAQERFADNDTYFLIDIRAELTDIAIVSSNVLISTVSFPVGRHGIIRAFKEHGMEEEQANTLLSLHQNNMLDEKIKNDLAPTIEQAKASWSSMFEKSLALLPKTVSVPSMIFLITDLDTALWFREVVADGIQIGSSIERKKFSVTSLGGQLFLDICKINDGSCDPFLMIEAIARSRLYASSN